MRKSAIVGAVLVAVVVLWTAVPATAETGSVRYSAPAAAGYGRGGIALSGGFTPIGDSDAGTGFGAPTYEDAFDTGWTLRVEPFFDFSPMFRGQFGIARSEWSGQTFNNGFGTFRFSDLKMTAIYVGLKVRFLPQRRFHPYAVVDLGGARLGSVTVDGSPYWGSKTTGFVDAGGGVEFEVGPNVAFFADLRLQATGKPRSEAPPDSDAEGAVSYPFTAGVSFTFGSGAPAYGAGPASGPPTASATRSPGRAAVPLPSF